MAKAADTKGSASGTNTELVGSAETLGKGPGATEDTDDYPEFEGTDDELERRRSTW